MKVGMRLLLSLVEVALLLIPTYIDTGVQIWNAINVNSLANDRHIHYQTPIGLQDNRELEENTALRRSDMLTTTTEGTERATKQPSEVEDYGGSGRADNETFVRKEQDNELNSIAECKHFTKL